MTKVTVQAKATYSERKKFSLPSACAVQMSEMQKKGRKKDGGKASLVEKLFLKQKNNEVKFIVSMDSVW